MATTETSLKMTAMFADGETSNIKLDNIDQTVTTASTVKSNIATVNSTNNIGNTFVSSGGAAFSKFSAAEIIETITDRIYDSATYGG